MSFLPLDLLLILIRSKLPNGVQPQKVSLDIDDLDDGCDPRNSSKLVEKTLLELELHAARIKLRGCEVKIIGDQV